MQNEQDFAPHDEVTGNHEFDRRVAQASRGKRRRQLHLDVAGGIEDEGNEQHAPRAFGGTIQAFVDQHHGVLDEADLDPPGRVALAPLGGKMQYLLVALVIARTVADEQ